MKKFILALFTSLLFSGTLSAQDYWGIGIRAGDPTGVTAKKYMGDHALEINVGRTNMFYGSGWYDNRFYDWYRNENLHHNYRDLQYLNHSGSVPVSIQVHYLIHDNFLDIPDLNWYYGFGGQLRHQSYRFDYRYRYHNNNTWHYARGERVTNIDLGVDGVLGLEYTFPEFPLSVFLDGTVFLEVVDNPFRFHGQIGAGARYNF